MQILRILFAFTLAWFTQWAQGAEISEPTRPLIGAIRWDAWHGDQGVPGQAVRRSLSPVKYHWRLPFFAKVTGENQVHIDGTAQNVMDREIEYAADAGINYWAFVTYPEHDAMSLGLKRYLSSPRRKNIRFCLLTEASRWNSPTYVEWVTRLMQEPGYQTVLQNRPLLYLGFLDQAQIVSHWKDAQGFRAVLDTLRTTLRAKGLGNPYLVILDFSAAQGAQWAAQLGGDAISSYATTYAPRAATPYLELAQADLRFWEACRATGTAVVPIVTAGWDRRPRIEQPVPWETWQQPGVGLDQYVAVATPAELAEHLKASLDWLAQHAATAPARTSLVYAWNENDEGGWIVPTLQDGAVRLEAIKSMLQIYRQERPPGQK